MAASSTMQVTGCADPKIAPMVRGSFHHKGLNHQRPVYQRGQEAVHVYFWDERDGDSFCGWWFGPSVGGDQVWAYQPSRGMTPPTSGWHVPFGGAVDNTLVIRFAAPAAPAVRQQQMRPPAQAARPQQQQQQQQQPQQQQLKPQLKPQQQQQAPGQSWAQWQQQSPQQQALLEQRKAKEEQLKQQRAALIVQKRAEDEKNKRLQQEMAGIRAEMQKVRVATPETFEELRKKVDDRLQEELPKLSPEAANLLFEEYQQHVEFAEKRVETLKEQQKKNAVRLAEVERLRKEHLEANTTQEVEMPPEAVPHVLGKRGQTLMRIIAVTGCGMEVPTAWPQNGTPVSVRLCGGTKQRRLALEALHIIADGGDADDVAAAISKGALVVPHALDNPGREKWLRWRLKALEHEYGLKVALTANSVRVTPKEGAVSAGANPLAEGSEQRNTVGAAIEDAVLDAQGLVELDVNAKADRDPTDERMLALLKPWVDQYGVLVKARAVEEDVVPVAVLGPPKAARDAAAMLWASFNQGKCTAVVLQAIGRVQEATKLQAKDLEGDFRCLEEEKEVEVVQADTGLWISGSTAETVEDARQTIREMLQFYFPEDFFLAEGLTKAGLEKVNEDPEFRSHCAGPTCVVSVHPDEGTAWLCGTGRGAAQKRLEALAKPAGSAPAAPKAA